jgi:hypothetical protein
MALLGGFLIPAHRFLVVARYRPAAGVKIPQLEPGVGVPLLGRPLIPGHGLPVIPRHALAAGTLVGEHELRFGIAAFRRLAQPQQRLPFVGGGAGILGVEHRQMKLGIGIALHRRAPQPFDGVARTLRHAFAAQIHQADHGLRPGIALFGPSHVFLERRAEIAAPVRLGGAVGDGIGRYRPGVAVVPDALLVLPLFEAGVGRRRGLGHGGQHERQQRNLAHDYLHIENVGAAKTPKTIPTSANVTATGPSSATGARNSPPTVGSRPPPSTLRSRGCVIITRI